MKMLISAAAAASGQLYSALSSFGELGEALLIADTNLIHERIASILTTEKMARKEDVTCSCPPCSTAASALDR